MYEDIQNSLIREQEKRKALRQRMLNAPAYNPNQQVSGRSIPYSPIQGLSKIGQALIQRKQMEDSDARSKALNEQMEAERQAANLGATDMYFGKEEDLDAGTMTSPEREGAVEADPTRAMFAAASNPYTENMVPVMSALMAKEGKDGYTLGQGQTRFGADNQPVASVAAKPDKPDKMGVRPVALADGRWQDYSINAAGQPVEKVGAPYHKAATASPAAEDEYTKERNKLLAQEQGELKASATAASSSNNALDRMITASSKGAQGGAQPLITGVKNMLTSVGVGSETLTNEIVMGQSVAQMKVDLIAKFGARGLTDKDMQIIADALPKVNTSHDARIAVANILKKINTNTIKSYSESLKFQSEHHPAVKEATPGYIDEFRREELLKRY